MLSYPYDEGLKRIAKDFTNTVKPMIETIDHYGLKKRHLHKHKKSVASFYRRLGKGASGIEKKTIDRLQKNREKLFTFLDYDEVPWNNNNAEHAIKAFATLRRVIEGTTSQKGLHDYLVLLSICETCKYQDIDFLDFLLSGEKDVVAYAAKHKRRRQKTQDNVVALE